MVMSRISKKNTETESFSRYISDINLKQDVNIYSSVETCSGVVLFLIGTIQAICHVGFVEILFIIMAVCGVLLFSIGTFMPLLFKPVLEMLGKVGTFLGGYLLRMLMLPVYALLFVVAFIFAGREQKHYEFNVWHSPDLAPNPRFLPYVQSDFTKKRHKSIIGTVGNVMRQFSGNAVLLPVVLILLMIGMVFFFISAHSVFVFVYTLF